MKKVYESEVEYDSVLKQKSFRFSIGIKRIRFGTRINEFIK